MKRILFLTLALVLMLTLAVTPVMAKPDKKDDSCATITHGEVFYSEDHYLEGQPIPTGFDAYGYNYQAHKFKGSYFNSYAGSDGLPVWEGDDDAYLDDNPDAVDHWAWPYRDVKLAMKWSDTWLSNTDCDGDGLLDRGGPGGTSSGVPGAWLTNHQSGEYEDGTNWNYFVKIVAAPEDAYVDGGNWYTADDVEIGPVIWGAYAIIQQVENDPVLGVNGLQYISPNNAGLGSYAP